MAPHPKLLTPPRLLAPLVPCKEDDNGKMRSSAHDDLETDGDMTSREGPGRVRRKKEEGIHTKKEEGVHTKKEEGTLVSK